MTFVFVNFLVLRVRLCLKWIAKLSKCRRKCGGLFKWYRKIYLLAALSQRIRKESKPSFLRFCTVNLFTFAQSTSSLLQCQPSYLCTINPFTLTQSTSLLTRTVSCLPFSYNSIFLCMFISNGSGLRSETRLKIHKTDLLLRLLLI